MINKLNLPVAELLGAQTGKSKSFKIFAKIPSPDSQISIIKPIQGKVILEKLADTILGLFDIKTTLKLICVRCLKKFKKNIRLKYQQQFRTKNMNSIENVDALQTLEGDNLDILPSIQQEIILKIPLQVLCSEKCQGLCPKCGQDLNSKKCTCKKIPKSKPLAKLKEMMR